MALDRSFVERNRASTDRIRALATRLSDQELQHPVGEHWTVAITLAHLAFWDRRVMYVLDMTARDGKLFIPEIDIFVNDLSLRCGRPSRHEKPHGFPSKPPKRWTAGWNASRRHCLRKSTPIISAGSSVLCIAANIWTRPMRRCEAECSFISRPEITRPRHLRNVNSV